MIDTGKYEGHTEGPWEADLDDEGKRWIDAYDDEGDINLCRITNGNKADSQLIADAPLLLAEVKRLQGEPEVNCCPTCGSSDITIYDSFVDSGSHKVRCEADGCEARWFEMWRHIGIEMIEGDDNR